MEEQLIKTPVSYDPKQQAIRECEFGVILCELPRHFTTKDTEYRIKETTTQLGKYIATCINSHTALLAVAEAAERLRDLCEEHEAALPPGFGELKGQLAAWRKG